MSRSSFSGAALIGAALLIAPVAAQDTPGRGQPPRGGGQQDATPPGQQSPAQKVRVGEQVPDLALTDLDGKTHTIREHTQRGEIIVLEWLDPATLHQARHHGPEQPFHQTYERFHDQQNVTWLAVCSFGMSSQGPGGHLHHEPGHGTSGQPPAQRTQPQQPQQSGHGQQQPGQGTPMSRDQVIEMCRQAKEQFGIEYPILLDEGGRFAEQFGITHVPHVFIIDKTGRLAFSGPAEEASAMGQTGGPNYIAQALQQVISGQRVTIPERDARGTTLPAGSRRDQGAAPSGQPQPPSSGQPEGNHPHGGHGGHGGGQHGD